MKNTKDRLSLVTLLTGLSVVSRAQTSQRTKGLAVMMYLLGLSYGATSLALHALGVYMSKTGVYEEVQAAAEKVQRVCRTIGQKACQFVSLSATEGCKPLAYGCLEFCPFPRSAPVVRPALHKALESI